MAIFEFVEKYILQLTMANTILYRYCFISRKNLYQRYTTLMV